MQIQTQIKERNISVANVSEEDAKALVVTGAELSTYSEEDWDNMCVNK